MKIRGGYTFKLAGRPSGVIEDAATPSSLSLCLQRHGFQFTPTVAHEQAVEFGDILAETDGQTGPVLKIPAPASGTVSLERTTPEPPATLSLHNVKPQVVAGKYGQFTPERITRENICNLLGQGGIWPFFWSSKTQGIPSISEDEQPRAIIINCMLTEPFRARGRVILQHDWHDIIAGIKFLPRLLSEYGTVEIVLTHEQDPIAQMMLSDLAGFAWVKFHSVAIRYPVEHPRLLNRLLKETNRSYQKNETVWVINVQDVRSIGMMLADGIPLHSRIVALGGPGCPNPKHVKARIGTPLSSLLKESIDPDKVLVLRGGLLTGEPVDFSTESIQYDDDAFFFLPKSLKREMLHFVRPGFGRRSVFPAFISQLTGSLDKEITTSLRGEPRPCVACGMCEQLCPAGLLPQIIHRYVYRDALEEAKRMGIAQCIDCGLCTFVCPSKIELTDQFANARERIREEHL